MVKRIFKMGLLIILCSCSSDYYQKLNKELVKQNYAAALESIKSAEKSFYGDRDRLLFFMDAGLVALKMGKHEISNQFLDQADRLISQRNKAGIASVIAAYTISEGSVDYLGDAHERVMVNLLRSLNYLALQNYENAIAMARRVNNTMKEYLFKMRDEVAKSAGEGQEKNVRLAYTYDAFAEYIVAKCYKMLGKKEIENALISYRLAIEHYQDDFALKYQVKLPRQVTHEYCQLAESKDNPVHWKDESFQKKMAVDCTSFGSKTDPWAADKGNLLVFQFQGLMPTKKNITLDIPVDQKRLDGVLAGLAVGGVLALLNPKGEFLYNMITGVIITNPWIYFSVLAQIEALNTNQQWAQIAAGAANIGGMLDTNALRLSVPVLVESNDRQQDSWLKEQFPAAGSTRINLAEISLKLEKVTDLAQIAIQNNKDQLTVTMLRSLSRSILKKLLIDKAQEAGPAVAIGVSIVSKGLDTVDTRMWQTLPSQVEMANLDLSIGKHRLQGTLDGVPFSNEVEIKANQTSILIFQTYFSSPNARKRNDDRYTELNNYEARLRQTIAGL